MLLKRTGKLKDDSLIKMGEKEKPGLSIGAKGSVCPNITRMRVQITMT